ncbi:MAG: AmmeMemoRadiSam system radical SAM enzyme [Candidatus Omnitrophica bacterium]|nr:AmmeMemoRadiSam system radical SAM enzyme [Candidatus Omnitrophota bacterium]MDD5488797.1 AmmeMemoRadiSam system radical SAM enzyme [Candidatus Omnitrophota bacterium]
MDILARIEEIWSKRITRREFLHEAVRAGAMIAAASGAGIFPGKAALASVKERRGMREALYYETLPGGKVKCVLCPNNCVMGDGQRGFCRAREPENGKLYSLVYELICASHIDPIEKKPVFHMLPGSKAFSIATAGCNSRCKYCQNWGISQVPPEDTDNSILTCSSLVSNALAAGCDSIAYTYTEPVVFYEYVMDASRAAREGGLRNIIVTGGKICPEPLRAMCGVIDAANVDLKGFDREYLRSVCAQELDDILATLKMLRAKGVWLEITNLLVPGLNDNMADIRRMAKWIRDELGPDVPLHFSRFWPQYKLRYLNPTPVDTLRKARDIAREEGLFFVYIGNVPDPGAEDTICPGCGKTVIRRMGYKVLGNDVGSGRCKYCGTSISGIWK